MINEAQPYLKAIIEEVYSRLANDVIKSLRELPERSSLSGEDSPLIDVWEEICSQIQDQHSFYWDAYIKVLDTHIEHVLKALDPALLKILWIDTESFIDWEWDENKIKFEHNSFLDAVSEELQDRILSLATNYELDPDDE